MVYVVALIPAHNEAEGIAATIDSMLGQTRVPDRIVVVCNNCTDETEQIARQFPVIVHVIPDCPDRKAGAMNEGWRVHGADADLVFTMDGDTVLFPDTIEQMIGSFADVGLAAVTARYLAKDNSTLVRRLQALEYARYDDTRAIRGWKVQVASGAAVMYRNPALREVCRAYDRDAPWDGSSLIEDYGLTLDLKTLGWRVAACPRAFVLTDTPATFRELWRQRLRWGRGGVDEVRRHGWSAATRRDILAYWLFGVSILMRLTWVAVIVLMIRLGLGYQVSAWGACALAVMWLDRYTSVWSLQRSGKDRLLVGVLVIEDLYGFFLEACTLASIFKSLRRTRQAW